MFSLPQTMPALYAQLVRAGYDERALARVRAASELATQLTSGRHRPSGKPFMCHLVGTAAALASAGTGSDAVIAGLLHAAYVGGEWGDGVQRMDDAKRRQLRRHVGAEVEERVARYSTRPWNPGYVAELVVGRLDPVDRDVVAMRLANEVDDHLDLGILYGRAAEERRALAAQALPDWLRLARELGLERLAEALVATVEPAIAGEVPAILHTGHWRSYLLPPRSHRTRLLSGVRHALADTDDRVRRWVKRLGWSAR